MLTYKEEKIADWLLGALNSDPRDFPVAERHELKDLSEVAESILERKNLERIPTIMRKYIGLSIRVDPVKPAILPEIERRIWDGKPHCPAAICGFEAIIRLSQMGALGRVKRCEECNCWIFVRVVEGKRRQRFCEKHSRADDERYRQLQALYQKHKRKDPRFSGTDFFSSGRCNRKGCELCEAKKS